MKKPLMKLLKRIIKYSNYYRDNSGLADPLVIAFMCVTINPEIRLMPLNEFNHIQRIKSRHERAVHILGVWVNDRRMMRDDNARS